MFTQAETVLNPLFLTLTVLFLTFIGLRIRGVFFKKKSRTPIWKKETGLSYRIWGMVKTVSLPMMAAGIIYFLFIVLIFTAILHTYVKTLFILIFSAWVLLEICMSLSIPENLPRTPVFRRIIHFITVLVCLAGAVLLCPKIIQSYPFPAESECVLLDLPVRGEWLAGHAGATELTNAHFRNRYAIDCLKIGPEGRFFKEPEEDVTDFYSYGEPVYAPADGQITEVVDELPGDVFGEPDTDHPGGNYVILDIGNGKYFYVAHLMKDRIPVEEGQVVQRGDILGYVGNSGNTSFPHLHIHVQNKPTADPEGRITYPFRFKTMLRKRLLFWLGVSNAALIRNDRFHE
ncbi:MAG: peptidoglycan DD-metalloendopeptidase family protein [Deltaproteobacteria bacterium]|nr:peptidoglycan DD-metalloendopeptidase family protein [Deltaproteobacteria bacterium]